MASFKIISTPDEQPQTQGKFKVIGLPGESQAETIAGRPNRPLDASYFINKEVIPGMGMPEKLANLFSMGAQNTGAGIGQLGRMSANNLAFILMTNCKPIKSKCKTLTG